MVLGGAPLNAHEETEEMINELMEIAKADAVLEHSEEDEIALFELTEHLRLAAIFLHSIYNQPTEHELLH